ncbi:MAG: hypothetical protein HYZ53_10500 [Planctomycetes bacterium]|nr:hypothetical protein [Planctomycetota bacterium]
MSRIRTICAAMVLLLAVAFTVSAETIAVRLETTDGNIVLGTTELTFVKFESSLGALDLRVRDIQELRFADGQVDALLLDGSSLHGRLAVEVWPVKTKMGDLKVPVEKLLWVGIGATSKQAAPRGAGPSPAPAGGGGAGAVEGGTAGEGSAADGRGGAGGKDGSGSPAAAPQPAEVRPPGGSADGGAGDPTPTEGSKFVQRRRVALRSSISALAFASDGRTLFVLNVTDSEVDVIPTSTFQVSKRIAVPGKGRRLSVSPDGSRLAALAENHLVVIDVAAGRVTKTIPAPLGATDVCLFGADTALVTTDGAQSASGFVSLSRQAPIATVRSGLTGWIREARNPRRLYTQSAVVYLPEAESASSGASVPVWTEYPEGGPPTEIAVSPDGKWGVSRVGTVFRLGRSLLGDVRPFTDLAPHSVAVFLADNRRLVLFVPGGAASTYEVPSFEKTASSTVGFQAYAGVASLDRNAAYVLGGQESFRGGPPTGAMGATGWPVADLYELEFPP